MMEFIKIHHLNNISQHKKLTSKKSFKFLNKKIIDYEYSSYILLNFKIYVKMEYNYEILIPYPYILEVLFY